MREKINLREYGVVIGFLALCVMITIATPAFASHKNILNLLRQSSIIGIISAGMTFVIISGNFDISVGAVAALSGAVIMKLATSGVNLFLAMILALAVCGVIGSINGFVVAKIGIPSLITTMAMVSIVKGSMLMLTGGYPITETFVVLDAIGNGYLMGIPVPVVIFALTVLGAWVVLSKTRFGRYVYSVGGNADVAQMMGINTRRALMLGGLMAGFFFGFAGVMKESYAGYVVAQTGLSSLSTVFQPLAAVLLAQALQKHINIAIGIPISTFLIAMIFNILTLMGVPSGTFQEFLLGVIVVVFGITAQRNVKGVVK